MASLRIALRSLLTAHCSGLLLASRTWLFFTQHLQSPVIVKNSLTAYTLPSKTASSSDCIDLHVLAYIIDNRHRRRDAD